MATAGSKTPVSILNEYFIRKGLLPKFDLVINGYQMQKPSFAYVVQCGKEMAVGEGRSKQEAKHQAARKMLELLNISCECEYEEDVKQLVVPYENSIGYNAVGELAEYCRRNCYPEVIYDCISEKGPPHARIFTVKCYVSKLCTMGVARTKKEAKHIAAHKMVMQLQKEAGEEPMAVALPNKNPTVDDSDVIELPKGGTVYQPHVSLYKEFCNAYLDLEEKSETLAKIFNNWETVTLENACSLVLDISKELGVTVCIETVVDGDSEELPLSLLENNCQVSQKKYASIFITMQLHPPVVAMDSDTPTAALSLLECLKELVT